MESTVEREAKARIVDAALKSRTFARSDQLQSFLRYICELELADRGDEITEYSIATAALRRPTDYAPGDDSSVRSRAHALRRKLKDLYETELTDAEWRIEVPKGCYRPIFVEGRCSTALVEVEPPVAIPVSQPPSQPIKSRFQMRSFLVGMAVSALVALVVLMRWRAAGGIDPILREAWGPALTTSSDVLIVISCPAVAKMLPSAPDLVPRPTNSELAPADLVEWYKSQHLEDRGGPLYMFRSRGYNVLSDTLATAQIGALVSSAGASFQVVPENTVQPTSIHERGLVLIGSPAFAPFIARLLKITPFSIRFDRDQNDEVISDGPSETRKAVFTARRNKATNRFSTVYGLITVLPSQPGRDRPGRTLIFSGITGSPGAQAAAQFFSSPAALRDLKERFRRQGYKEFPPAYQVVVRCGVDAESAMNSVYETHRIMSNTPVIE